jgi:hypothetical protein
MNLLKLECLSGPLDGFQIELVTAEEWSCKGEGPLAFPWDMELGSPQARIFPQEDGWYLEGYSETPHATHCLRKHDTKVVEAICLEDGDMIRASGTWFRVHIEVLEMEEQGEF